MSFYSIVLFFHITGAVGIFVGLGLEWMMVYNFSRVTTNSQALQWTGTFKTLPVTFGISGVLILISGIYMAVANWGMPAWVSAGLVLYLFLAIFGSVVVAKKVGAIVADLDKENENLSDAIIKKLKSPLLTQSLKIRVAIALGIIFMMTIKPGWTGTIETVAVSILLGYLLTKITK